MKEDVEKSLPPKEEIIIEVALTTIQKQFYRAVYERNTTFLFKGLRAKCCAVPCCAVLCCAVLCCAVLCYAVLCVDVLFCCILCYVVLCYAMLCSALMYCAMLCCAVMFYTMLLIVRPIFPIFLTMTVTSLKLHHLFSILHLMHPASMVNRTVVMSKIIFLCEFVKIKW